MPITSLRLDHRAASGRISTGILGMDRMLGGGGYYLGSSVLVSGAAGTGKTSIAAQFVAGACERGERALYFSFEESSAQLQRNMRSIGVSLAPHIAKGLLRIHSMRPTMHGMEMHLATMLRLVREAEPQVVVVDPLSSIGAVGISEGAQLGARLVDFLKASGITALYTDLTGAGTAESQTGSGVSSLMDTWLIVRELESNGERHRGLYILKSRGMAHSNRIREFLMTGHGIELRDLDVGPEAVREASSRLGRPHVDRETRRLSRSASTSETNGSGARSGRKRRQARATP